jgi:hypothetical protein
MVPGSLAGAKPVRLPSPFMNLNREDRTVFGGEVFPVFFASSDFLNGLFAGLTVEIAPLFFESRCVCKG